MGDYSEPSELSASKKKHSQRILESAKKERRGLRSKKLEQRANQVNEVNQVDQVQEELSVGSKLKDRYESEMEEQKEAAKVSKKTAKETKRKPRASKRNQSVEKPGEVDFFEGELEALGIRSASVDSLDPNLKDDRAYQLMM